jgi:hypothetical protein
MVVIKYSWFSSYPQNHFNIKLTDNYKLYNCLPLNVKIDLFNFKINFIQQQRSSNN